MEWIKSKIYTTSAGIEPISAMLIGIDINGFQIEDQEELDNFINANEDKWDYVDEEFRNERIEETTITFYVSNNICGEEELFNVRNGLEMIKQLELPIDLGRMVLETEHVDDENWINNWKKYYKPFKVGEKIVIKPTWEEYTAKDEEIVFNIFPGHVFGTGLHQSTKLCICQLEKYVDESKTVLDLGCGSGILSIIALLLGAKQATAIDIDPNAVDIAYENAGLNNISKEQYYVTSGDVIKDENAIDRNKKYDIVVANIVADVIMSLLPTVNEVLEEDGVFISSGIIKERHLEVVSALENSGFQIISINEMDEWISIVAKRGNE